MPNASGATGYNSNYKPTMSELHRARRERRAGYATVHRHGIKPMLQNGANPRTQQILGLLRRKLEARQM